MTEKIGFGLQFDFRVVLTVGGSRLFVMSGCEGLEQQHSFSFLLNFEGFDWIFESSREPNQAKREETVKLGVVGVVVVDDDDDDDDDVVVVVDVVVDVVVVVVVVNLHNMASQRNGCHP